MHRGIYVLWCLSLQRYSFFFIQCYLMPSFSQCHLTSSLPQLLFGSSSTLYGFSLYLTSCDLKCIWFVFEFMMGFLVTMLSSFSIFFLSIIAILKRFILHLAMHLLICWRCWICNVIRYSSYFLTLSWGRSYHIETSPMVYNIKRLDMLHLEAKIKSPMLKKIIFVY